MFPLILEEGVKKQRITLPQMARLMSEGPARVAGLYPKKGSASIGADADFAVFDMDHERSVKVEDQVGVEWTLYEGMQAIYPERVLVRGPSRKDPGQLSGRTENNRVVNFKGSSDLIGTFVNVNITEALPNSLRGELCSNTGSDTGAGTRAS